MGTVAQVRPGICFLAALLLTFCSGCGDAKHTFSKLTQGSGDTGVDSGSAAVRVVSYVDKIDISALDFSPDAQHLAVSTNLGAEVRIWSWNERKPVNDLSIPSRLGFGAAQSGLRFSPDGKWLAIVHGPFPVSDGVSVARIWDARTGKIVRDIVEPRSGAGVGRLEFSPDGELLLRLYGRVESVPGDQFTVHRTDTWKADWGMRTTPYIPEAMAVSPDGKKVALGGGVFAREPHEHAQIMIVDLPTHKVLKTIETGWTDREVQQVAWSSNGERIAVAASQDDIQAGEEAIKIFDASSGARVGGHASGQCKIAGLDFTVDGKYLIFGGQGLDVQIWDARRPVLLQRIPIAATALAVSRDGHYLAIAKFAETSVWKLN